MHVVVARSSRYQYGLGIAVHPSGMSALFDATVARTVTKKLSPAVRVNGAIYRSLLVCVPLETVCWDRSGTRHCVRGTQEPEQKENSVSAGDAPAVRPAQLSTDTGSIDHWYSIV